MPLSHVIKYLFCRRGRHTSESEGRGHCRRDTSCCARMCASHTAVKHRRAHVPLSAHVISAAVPTGAAA